MDCPLLFLETLESFKYSTATYTMMEDRVILHSMVCMLCMVCGRVCGMWYVVCCMVYGVLYMV